MFIIIFNLFFNFLNLVVSRKINLLNKLYLVIFLYGLFSIYIF